MHIDLFIAPDGEFRHMTPDRRHAKAVMEPIFRMPHPLDLDEDISPSEASGPENKIFHRYRLSVSDAEPGRRIPTRPSPMWNNFLRRVIADLETKGDAPWKREG